MAHWGRAVAALMVGFLVWAPLASAHDDVRLTRISGRSPFRHACGVPGDPTKAAEGEPHLAVNPRDPRHLVAAWQQDRFAVYGGALSNLVSVSRDGGRTWRGTMVEGLSQCTGGKPERTSDPWLSFDRRGHLYLSSLTFNFDASGQISQEAGEELAGPTALSAARSDDGGRSWGPQVTVVDDKMYDDREAITADPTRRNVVYMAWVRREGLLGENGVEYFSRTTDGGRHWETPRPISPPLPGFFTDPTLIEVLPNGTLLNFYLLDNGSFALPPPSPVVPWKVMVSRSTDGGDTFSAPEAIATVQPYPPSDPDTGADVRAIPLISTAVAPDGTAYVAWNEKPSRDSYNRGFVRLARSRDNGRSWSDPNTVAKVSGQTFLPALAVAKDGSIGVMFDSTRRDRRGDDEFTADVWLARSKDEGKTWSHHHAAGPFDLLTAPRSGSAGIGGIFLGDYQELVGLPHGFGGVFAAPNPVDLRGDSDIFYLDWRLDDK